MKIQNISAFPIPISYGSFGEQSRTLNKHLMADTIKHTYSEFETRSGIGVRQSSGGLENHYESFKALQDIISIFSKTIVEWTGIETDVVEAVGLWANLNNDPYAYHMPHAHSLKYVYTGVYFPTSGILDGHELSLDQNLDDEPNIISDSRPAPGSLVLLDPNQNIKDGISNGKSARFPFFGNPICVEPREGTIVIFPSYLSHMVTPTKKENFTRVSIAFNIRTD